MRPKRSPDVVWRIEKGMHQAAWEKARKGEDYEDLGVLTLMAKGSIHQLNLVAAEIWTRINGVNTVDRIAAEIAALFDADPAGIAGDVADFISDGMKRGWLTLPDGTGPDPRWTAPR